LEISGSKSGNIDGLELVVSATEQEAAAKVQEEPHAGLIELLKEQQWKVPFATAFASTGELVESIQVAGTVDTPPGGSAVVGAPVSGRLIAPARGLPRPGDTVTKGTLLASLAPAPSSPEGAARATLAVAEAHARVGAAKAALERAKRLIAEEAISQRELEDREREQGLAEEAVKAAKHAQALFSGAQAGGSAGAWRLSAPIAGTLSEVRATPGASVSPQDVLFRIVDTSELWIRARVPEQDATKLRKDKSAAYQLLGLDVWHPIQLGSETGDSLVSVSKTVDPVARTVDIIYRLSKPSAELRVGGLVQVSLPVGSDFKGIVIPRTAVVDDAGKSVVYVQLDGEHFEERLIRLGPQSGATLGVVSGLKAKERVVTRGAHLVRLAERAANSPTPHGHIH
jgi:RND family efflux transporter MFP subunit